MRVLLYRVDDRLIHGQVVLGWGRSLAPSRLVVVDDRIAADDWERELLAAAAPPEMRAEFMSVWGAAARLAEDGSRDSAFVILESPAVALHLADAGVEIPELNLGGLHREGGLRVTPYLYLLPEDVTAVRSLVARGVRVYAQDVPGGKRIEADALLDA